MGETAKADLNATTYVHQPTLPLRQGDDEMRLSDWTAGVECDGAGVSGTRAGMRPKCLRIIFRSLSELALLDLLFSLAGALVDNVPNRPSLSVPDDMSYSAVPSVVEPLCP